VFRSPRRSLQRKIKPHARGLDGFLKVGGRGCLVQNHVGKGGSFRRAPLCARKHFQIDGRRSSVQQQRGDYAERASTLLTVWACQRPPRAVATPRAFSAAAMARNDLASARCISRMTRRTFAACLRVGGDGFLRRPCGLCDLPANRRSTILRAIKSGRISGTRDRGRHMVSGGFPPAEATP
jgi:hypothetical protein